jgi:hypothetical protein
VIRDRLEFGIVGLEVLEEIESDDRVELRVQAQRLEAGAVGRRDRQVTIDDPESCGDPRQGVPADFVDAWSLELGG